MTAIRAISKMALFDQIKYAPHPGQLPYHRSRARNRVVAGGRRTGKSKGQGVELVPEAYKAYLLRRQLEDTDKRREFWIVGPEYSDSEKEFRVLHDVLKRLRMPFDKPGTYNDPISGNMHISLWDGRFQVHAKSAKHPETLVGEGLAGVLLSEAAKLKRSVWIKYIRPTLSDFHGWSSMASTPEGRNWFYEMWQAGQDPAREDWWSTRVPAWANPHVYPMGATDAGIRLLRLAMERGGSGLTDEVRVASGVDPEIIALLQDLTEEAFNQEIAALFNEFVGRVFSDFDEELHVTDLTYNRNYATYAACDYGWREPFVWLLIQEDVWGTVYVLDELYIEQTDINEIADIIRSRGLAPEQLKTFYPDPSSPGDSAVLAKKLRLRIGGGTGGELNDRLTAIRRGLKLYPPHLPDGHPAKLPRLYIDRKCAGLIRELNAYRYPELRAEASRNAPEKPMDKDNHGPEALGRYYAGRYGKPNAGRSRVRAATLGG